MAIWVYKYQHQSPSELLVRCNDCNFCRTEMQSLYSETRQFNNFHKSVKVCPVCGWWNTWEQSSNLLRIDDRTAFNLYGTISILKQFDLTNLEQPIEDVEQYLAAKFADRFTLHPRLFEEVVTSIFKNLGFHATITSYHKDGGIDVILQGKNNTEIGVQVKRYKGAIRVSQIREFAGALIENKMTTGIFVTTSKFQTGVFNSVGNFAMEGLRIELLDSKRLYDALKLSLRNRYKDYQELVEIIGEIELPTIYENKTDYR